MLILDNICVIVFAIVFVSRYQRMAIVFLSQQTFIKYKQKFKQKINVRMTKFIFRQLQIIRVCILTQILSLASQITISYPCQNQTSNKQTQSDIIKINFVIPKHYYNYSYVRMIPWILIYFQLLINIVNLQCPPNCSCQTKTLACEVCLSSYYQTYDLTIKNCRCINGFEKFRGGGHFCCPNNCQKCYKRGCGTCKRSAKNVWNNTLKYYACECQQNYYLNQSECKCLSNLVPNSYYINPENDACLRCPQGCNCSSRGCTHCTDESNRVIKGTLKNILICDCILPFVEIDGNCLCPKNCRCGLGEVDSCTKESNRQQKYRAWECKDPYKQINGQCKCDEPYIELQVYGQIKCVCKSRVNYTSYYQVNEICSKCPQSCTCDKFGCSSCINPLRSVYSLKCNCNSNSSQINNNCQCIDPYFQSQNGKCQCLSILYPTLYYYSLIFNQCHVCPEGCKCSQLGCFSCDQESRRQVISNFYQSSNLTLYDCECGVDFENINDTCLCKTGYYYDNQTKSCLCLSFIQPFIAYSNYFSCQPCPKLCLCDERGCYQCDNSSMRVINIEDDGTHSCYCEPPLQQFNNGICSCSDKARYNKTTKLCNCVDPYFTTQVFGVYQVCECMFKIDQTMYYEDIFTSQCNTCPKGCLCSYLGCYSCRVETLRNVNQFKYIQYPQVPLYRCPCVQNAFQINGTCRVCPLNSYYNGQNCTYCFTCKTCNMDGCVSCFDSMILIQRQCTCQNQNLTNVDGFCTCSLGYYLIKIENQTDHLQCLICPPNCLTCKSENGLVSCLSCNSEKTNRVNSIENGCPCKQGYTQIVQKRQYCCSVYCETCDDQGCLSCPLSTFRTLINRKCQCLIPFQQLSWQRQLINANEISEQFQIVCGCQRGFYYFNQSCIMCPLQCQECFYDELDQLPFCTICKKLLNRNSSSINCDCVQGFQESNPKKQYCVSIGCQSNQQYCQKCRGLMILDVMGRCVCPDGYYNNESICLKCFVAGCYLCLSKTTCVKCNEKEGYYLSHNICFLITRTNFLFSQTGLYGYYIEIKLDQTTFGTSSSQVEGQHNSKIFGNLFATLYKVNNTESEGSIQLKIKDAIFQQMTICLILQNPQNQLDDYILSLSIYVSDSNWTTLNILTSKIFSKDHLTNKYQSVALEVLVMVIMLASLIATIFGYKYNQSIFFLQTMLFLVMFQKEQQLQTSKLLFNLKFSILLFEDNILLSLVPKYYLQSSAGNFKYLTIDSNIFRIAPISLICQCLVILLFIAFKIGFYLTAEISGLGLREFKKKLFRVGQFFFKINMYPILFFSFNSLINVHCTVYVKPQFKIISISLSILFVVAHFLFVGYFFYCGGISKLNRYELVYETLCDTVVSLIIILLSQLKTVCIILLMAFFVIKDGFYLTLKKSISEQLTSVSENIIKGVKSIQFIGSILQILSPALIRFNFSYPSVVVIIITGLFQLLCHFRVLFLSRKKFLLNQTTKIDKQVHQKTIQSFVFQDDQSQDQN